MLQWSASVASDTSSSLAWYCFSPSKKPWITWQPAMMQLGSFSVYMCVCITMTSWPREMYLHWTSEWSGAW